MFTVETGDPPCRWALGSGGKDGKDLVSRAWGAVGGLGPRGQSL